MDWKIPIHNHNSPDKYPVASTGDNHGDSISRRSCNVRQRIGRYAF